MNINNNFKAIIDTPFTLLGISMDENSVRGIEFLSKNSHRPFIKTELGERLYNEIQCYLENPAHVIDIPLSPTGTAFQLSVWRIMQKIGAGNSMSYGDVANKLSSSPRAVGNACRRNPIPLIIPCHRIVAKNGLGGFAGKTQGELIDIKRRLLLHENSDLNCLVR